MRAFLVGGLMAALTLFPVAVAAQDTETLRRELEQMRTQFDRMKEDYQKAIDSMTERLRRLEQQAVQPAPPPLSAPTGPLTTSPAARQPSLMELAQPRQPFVRRLSTLLAVAISPSAP